MVSRGGGGLSWYGEEVEASDVVERWWRIEQQV